jgi:hypothetical protein
VSRIVEIIRRVVLEELDRNRGSLLGVVTTVYPHEAEDDENNYEANVRLKHEDLELRRVPIVVGHVGVAAPPRIGDLVLVQFLNGDSNQPLVTGRFYHADERPPLHREDEILLEQRVPDGTLNHLRFAADGTIYLQRDVKRPGDNGEATTSIKVEAEGNVEFKVGEKITVRLTLDDNIQVVADGLPITVDCDTMKVTTENGMTVEGDLKVTNGTSSSTTIRGNEIMGALQP